MSLTINRLFVFLQRLVTTMSRHYIVYWWKCSFYPLLESLVNLTNARNSNHTHHLSVYTYSSYIHHKCGDIVYLHSGFTRASNKIDDVTPHFLFYPLRLKSHELKKLHMKKSATSTIKQIIGVEIVQSPKIGVHKHEYMYPIIFFFTILFFICWIIALIWFICL